MSDQYTAELKMETSHLTCTLCQLFFMQLALSRHFLQKKLALESQVPVLVHLCLASPSSKFQFWSESLDKKGGGAQRAAALFARCHQRATAPRRRPVAAPAGIGRLQASSPWVRRPRGASCCSANRQLRSPEAIEWVGTAFQGQPPASAASAGR